MKLATELPCSTIASLATEVRNRRRRAVALEAKLNVAREVVLADTRRTATNTERGERRVGAARAREHELNLAERAER